MGLTTSVVLAPWSASVGASATLPSRVMWLCLNSVHFIILKDNKVLFKLTSESMSSLSVGIIEMLLFELISISGHSISIGKSIGSNLVLVGFLDMKNRS